MPDDKSKQFNPNSIRALFLSCFVALLFLEVALALVGVRFHKIQNDILKDQALLLRSRELLSDTLRDSERAWKSLTTVGENSLQPQSPPASSGHAIEVIAKLQRIARPSLAFPSMDLDRLEGTLANNLKLLSAPAPHTSDQKSLMEKTLSSLSAFVAAIDIRLFSAMQELRRDVEFLQMLTWGILPVLMLSTIIFGFLLQARVMQPLHHLKKQSRKLTDSIVTLQKELRVFEAEKKASIQVATAPLAAPLDTTTGVDDLVTKQV